MTRDTKTTRQDDKGKIERRIRGDGLSLSERIIREGSWRKQRSSCKLNEKEPGEPDDGGPGGGLDCILGTWEAIGTFRTEEWHALNCICKRSLQLLQGE